MTDYTDLQKAAEYAAQDTIKFADEDEEMRALQQFHEEVDPEKVLALIAENQAPKGPHDWLAEDLIKELVDNAQAIQESADDGEEDQFVIVLLASASRIRRQEVNIDQLRAKIAGLKTGYEAYERVNAELKAECERLGAENTDIESAAITYIEDMQEAHHENERLKAEVDSLTREADRQYTTIEAYRKDAERLQWLLKNASVILDKKTAYQTETGFIKFDTMPGRTETALAIDAAMGQGDRS